MNRSRHATPKLRPDTSFWRSRLGVALIIFIAISGVLLIYEHRIHLLTGNAFIVALLAFCVGVHFFLHRGQALDDRHREMKND